MGREQWVGFQRFSGEERAGRLRAGTRDRDHGEGEASEAANFFFVSLDCCPRKEYVFVLNRPPKCVHLGGWESTLALTEQLDRIFGLNLFPILDFMN